MLARFAIFLSALFAAWTLAFLPGLYFQDRRNFQYRQGFYENIAVVPILAVFGAISLFTIHRVSAPSVERSSGGRLARWGQLLIAIGVALAQVWFVRRAVMNAAF